MDKDTSARMSFARPKRGKRKKKPQPPLLLFTPLIKGNICNPRHVASPKGGKVGVTYFLTFNWHSFSVRLSHYNLMPGSKRL
jgi:hypothetical protein